MSLRTMDFRDGTRQVPEHLAVRMAGLDISTLTFEQAVRAADSHAARTYLNNLQARVISDHMRNIHR